MRFADTNVLLYAISPDPTEQTKARLANRILEEGDVVLSTQVLPEIYVQATRATRPDALTHEQAAGLVAAFHRFPTTPITVEIVQAALATRVRFGLSYWDAAILEAARASGCDVVLSEDLAHGRDYDGVSVVDAFLQELVSA